MPTNITIDGVEYKLTPVTKKPEKKTYTIKRLADGAIFFQCKLKTTNFMTYAYDSLGCEIGGNHGFRESMIDEDFEIINEN